MTYETVIGLEVHAELSVNTKLFCACSAKFGAEQNENVCPACCGMPGMPAVLNKRAVELGIAAGILTESEIANVVSFDKKNYFYPDLPAGYQITQYFSPICKNGKIHIEAPESKTITLKQIHIEQDAGKLVHDGRAGCTYVDYNRAGVPLIEIVSNADFNSGAEVLAYLEKLREILSFAKISDCKMQEGSMRCDINVSVRKKGEKKLGTRTEIKNMNSLKAIAAAIEYESARHIEALETGSEVLIQETRRWDESEGATFSMREKEDATDYRYFPDAEIVPVTINTEWIEKIRAALPETARNKYLRLTGELGLSDYDAKIITGSRNLSDIFDETMKHFNNPKEIANWIIVELLSVAKGDNKSADDIKLNCAGFAKIITFVNDKTINRNVGKKMIPDLLKDGEDFKPEKYIEENNLGMLTDANEIAGVVREVLSENQKSVAEYKKGNQKVVGFLMGQIMRKLGGKADPQVVGELINGELSP